MSRVTVGKVAPIPKGIWNSTSTYEKLNMVNKGGILYIAKDNVPIGTDVNNTNYWMKASEKLTIGSVTTVSATAGANATINEGTDGQILNLQIPRGIPGNESIDDMAGLGDTDKVWSADRSVKEIESVTGLQKITGWTPDKYIQTNLSTVDITVEKGNNLGYGYVIVSNVAAGDKFTINGSGASQGRLWAFIDSQNNVLSRANSNITARNLIITAPENSTALILNSNNFTFDCYKGTFTVPTVPKTTNTQQIANTQFVHLLTDDKADIIILKKEAGILNITDAKELVPDNAVIHFLPHQEMYGYDHMIYPGETKNILDQDGRNENNGYVPNAYLDVNGDVISHSSYHISEYTSISPNTVYTISGLTGNAACMCFYDITHNLLQESTIQYANRTKFSFTSPNNAYYCRVSMFKNTVKQNNYMIELGNNATTFEYHKLLPEVSGWTGINLNSYGKNLYYCTLNSRTYQGIEYTNDNGKVILNGTAEATSYWTTTSFLPQYEDLQVFQPGTYTCSCSKDTVELLIYELYPNRHYTVIARNYGKVTFTITKMTHIFVNLKIDSGLAFDNEDIKLQIELGEEATGYEQYSCTTLSFPFDLNEPIYGGWINLQTGRLTRSHILFRPTIQRKQSTNSYGISNWRFIPPQTAVNYTNLTAYSNAFIQSNVSISDVQDECFMIGQNEGYVRLKSERADTVAQAQEYIDSLGMYIVYELRETQPEIKTLTIEEEVQLSKGSNIICTDVDGTTSITYQADTKLYIDNKISEANNNIMSLFKNLFYVEKEPIATKNYTNTDYFVCDGHLCYALSNIPIGSALIYGENYFYTDITNIISGFRNEINTLNENVFS